LFFRARVAILVPDGPHHAGKSTFADCCTAAPAGSHSIPTNPTRLPCGGRPDPSNLDHRANGLSRLSPKRHGPLAQSGGGGGGRRRGCGFLRPPRCIGNPIVLGASFGGMVALAYSNATIRRILQKWSYQHRGRVMFASGARVSLFERLVGGPEAGGAPPGLRALRFLRCAWPMDAVLARKRGGGGCAVRPLSAKSPVIRTVARPRGHPRPRKVLQWVTRTRRRGSPDPFRLFPRILIRIPVSDPGDGG